MKVSTDMSFYEMITGLFNTDFMSEEELETICKAGEMYAKAKVKNSNNEELIQLLTELEEYMDNKADADWEGDPGSYTPNTEMKLQVRIHDELRKLGQ